MKRRNAGRTTGGLSGAVSCGHGPIVTVVVAMQTNAPRVQRRVPVVLRGGLRGLYIAGFDRSEDLFVLVLRLLHPLGKEGEQRVLPTNLPQAIPQVVDHRAAHRTDRRFDRLVESSVGSGECLAIVLLQSLAAVSERSLGPRQT